MSFAVTSGGIKVWLQTSIDSSGVVAGLSVLVVASTLSLLAVIGMLIVIFITSIKNEHAFIRSHLGAYFVSLFVAEVIQSLGSIMSARWIALHEVELGRFCVTQAALKNVGNVSTALWSMVIAFHTFILVFLRMRVPLWTFYMTLVSTWIVAGFIIILGPAAIATAARGPYWGISGYWCWITQGYEVERFTMEYLFMFATAGVSLVLYTLIFFRMRGNIEVNGFRFKFCRSSTPWQGDLGMSDPQIARVGRTMLLYPITYIVSILPIAIARWSEVFNKSVPFAVVIFTDTLFLLSGVVNAILYITTRRVVPNKSRNLDDESIEGARNEQINSRESFTSNEKPVSGTPPDSLYMVPSAPPRTLGARGLQRISMQRGTIADSLQSAHSIESLHASVEDAGYGDPSVGSIRTATTAPNSRGKATVDQDWI